jgi:predicted acyl esterase
LRPDPIQAQPTYEAALAAFEAQDPVRILFENGAGGSQPGEPYPSYEQYFSEWPIPGAKRKSFYFARDGELRDKRTHRRGSDGFTWDADARPPTNFTGDTGSGPGGLWTALPEYEWSQPVEGNAVSYISKPLEEDMTAIGNGYVQMWVRSSKANVDLQATVSEVRPDNKETYVQSGWLRGKMRKLDPKRSQPLSPFLSLRKSDAKPLPDDRFTKATIPLYYHGHSYRAASRVRVVISAVGGDQPIWAFAEAQPTGTADVDLAFGKKRKSS